MMSSDAKVANQRRFLMAKKEKIEHRIRLEMSKRLPCSLTLSKLKKLKLAIKDRITVLSAPGRLRPAAVI